ncbi:MAG TPA: hypothetical protein RMH99_04860, partial [Sandaracinaceae bacterium LLY-WYZ-13_1]|nr:hypothetical protein [Sandaracinaceae bacterium LLY-WYZ-13_1]
MSDSRPHPACATASPSRPRGALRHAGRALRLAALALTLVSGGARAQPPGGADADPVDESATGDRSDGAGGDDGERGGAGGGSDDGSGGAG